MEKPTIAQKAPHKVKVEKDKLVFGVLWIISKTTFL